MYICMLVGAIIWCGIGCKAMCAACIVDLPAGMAVQGYGGVDTFFYRVIGNCGFQYRKPVGDV